MKRMTDQDYKKLDSTLRFIAKVCMGEVDAATTELILRKLADIGYVDTDGKVWRLKEDG